MFPSRYSHVAVTPGRELNVGEAKLVRCFERRRGELSKVFIKTAIFRDANLDHVHFLYEVVCVGFQGFLLEEQGLEFVKAVIEGATNLEMLTLDQWDEDDDRISLDDFCSFLSTQSTFLSKLRQFTILSTISFLGFVVSRKSFNQLITAYFAAPTDHVQKMEFSHVKIECSDISDDYSPTVDEHYLQFKAIELDDMCQFVSEFDATPTAISHWMGQDIKLRPQLSLQVLK